MNILYLTNKNNTSKTIEQIVRSNSDINIEFKTWTDTINHEQLKDMGVELVIKDKYPLHLEEKIFELGINIITFAPGYMPYNKGANSNLWSIIDDTPKGGSIYYMRDKFDYKSSYPVYLIKRFIVDLSPNETLGTSFEKIYKQIYYHFNLVWPQILTNQVDEVKFEKNEGSFHSKEDSTAFLQSLEKGYDTKISDIKKSWLLFNQKEQIT